MFMNSVFLSPVFLRLLLPYERHSKGENDKPVPLVKPKTQDPSPPEVGAKPKGPTTKRTKGQVTRKERDNTTKAPEHSQVSDKILPLSLSLSLSFTHLPDMNISKV